MSDPAPFPILTRPAAGAERPIVVSVPHAGVTIPAEERPYYGLDADGLLRDGDLYTDELYAGSELLGATMVVTPYSRFVVDLNRLPDDLSPASAEGAVEKNGPGYYGERGVLWAVTTHAERIYPEPLPADVVQRRLDRYYHPYHDTLAAELARLRDAFGYVVLLDAHSMPSRATRLHADAAGVRRADIVPGDLEGDACGTWLRTATCAHWEACGYEVAMNRPYKGGGITRRHADPANGVHAIQVELNRALYMCETTYEQNDGFAQLHRDCLGLVERLAATAPD